MSTRCQVRVIQEGLGWDESVTLYHHCDGYPSGMLPVIAEAFKNYGGDWRSGRTGHAAAFLCATQPTQFEPEEGHALHGDIEYYYKLFLVNSSSGSMREVPRWDVEVYATGFGDSPAIEHRGRLLHPRIEIQAAADKAREIEDSETEDA